MQLKRQESAPETWRHTLASMACTCTSRLWHRSWRTADHKEDADGTAESERSASRLNSSVPVAKSTVNMRETLLGSWGSMGQAMMWTSNIRLSAQ